MLAFTEGLLSVFSLLGQPASSWAAGATVLSLALIYPTLILRKYIRIVINVMNDCAPWPDTDGRDLGWLNGEEVSFRASDGHRLEGTIVRAKSGGASKGMVVFAHEFGNDRTSCLKYCRFVLEAGYDVFAFDFRAHGASRSRQEYRPRQWPSDREVADMIGAIAFITSWLEQQGRPREIVLFGVSRGAGSAVLAAQDMPEVRGIICDGLYSSDAILEYLMKRWATIFARIRVVAENHPDAFWKFLRWLLFRECMRRFGCRFPSVRKAVGRLGATPLLMIHGEKDSFIPVAHGRFLHSLARGPKDLLVVEGASHNAAIAVRPDLYEERVLAFLGDGKFTVNHEPLAETAPKAQERTHWRDDVSDYLPDSLAGLPSPAFEPVWVTQRSRG